MLLATIDSALTDEQVEQNIKLAKEAASKAVSEMYSSMGSSSPSRGITLALSEEANTNITKKEVVTAVDSETRQDSEDVTLQLSTHKEVECKSAAPLPWYYTLFALPYSEGQMRQWLEGGYIQNDLLLSNSRDGPFQELSTCYPDINKAFTCSLEMANESNGDESTVADNSQKQSNDEHAVSSENKKWGYAVGSDGTSTFESLWKKRTDKAADDKDEEPHYQFFNGQCSKVVTKLDNGVNEQDGSRPMEEDSREVTLWECDLCKSATFNTYEEAVQHERTCSQRAQHNETRTT